MRFHNCCSKLHQVSENKISALLQCFFFAPQDQISCGALQPQSVNYQLLQRKLRPNRHHYRTFASLLQSQLHSPVSAFACLMVEEENPVDSPLPRPCKLKPRCHSLTGSGPIEKSNQAPACSASAVSTAALLYCR